MRQFDMISERKKKFKKVLDNLKTNMLKQPSRLNRADNH